MRRTILCLAVIFSLSSCYKEKDFEQVNIDPDQIILSMSANRISLLANGSDTTLLTVEIPLNTKDDLSAVTFKTNSGTFSETSKSEAVVKATILRVNGLEKKIASVTFVSPLSGGSSMVSASVDNFTKSLNIKLSNNPPTSIKITSSATALNADPFSELTFTAQLSGAGGKVTPGQQVNLDIRDANSIKRGRFRTQSIFSNELGQATFVYNIMPDTAFRGKLIVTATTDLAGSQLKDTTSIYIVKYTVTP